MWYIFVCLMFWKKLNICGMLQDVKSPRNLHSAIPRGIWRWVRRGGWDIRRVRKVIQGLDREVRRWVTRRRMDARTAPTRKKAEMQIFPGGRSPCQGSRGCWAIHQSTWPWAPPPPYLLASFLFFNFLEEMLNFLRMGKWWWWG